MRLGDLIRKWRIMSERDLKSLADEIGISIGTLSRFEQRGGPDGTTLRKILVWALADADDKSGTPPHEEEEPQHG